MTWANLAHATALPLSTRGEIARQSLETPLLLMLVGMGTPFALTVTDQTRGLIPIQETIACSHFARCQS